MDIFKKFKDKAKKNLAKVGTLLEATVEIIGDLADGDFDFD